MKSLLVLLALTLTTSAFARDNGRINTNDGGAIIRIEVGNERDNDSRAMMKRMVQLERAVRELQNRVYDLEDDSRPQTKEVKVYTCQTFSDFGDSSIGAPAYTEMEARNNSKIACAKTKHEMFCRAEARCEMRIEFQRV